MKLQELRRPYDYVISLGSACQTTFQIKQNGLRTFSAPLDWMGSPSLADLNRLLSNRFQNFMKPENMKIIEIAHHNIIDDNDQVTVHQMYMLHDLHYNIISGHDFPVIPGKDWIDTYPSFREKIDRRIERFFETLRTSRSTLFVRYSASYEEVVALKPVLASLTGGEFHILVINMLPGITGIQEYDLGIEGVCSVAIPQHFGGWEGDSGIWRQLLSGITLANR